MKSVRLDVPETQVLALVRQLSPEGRQAVLRMLVPELGELDDTLIIYIWGDNGASMEGTFTGSFNETTFFNGVILEPSDQLEVIEKYGGVAELGGERLVLQLDVVSLDLHLGVKQPDQAEQA